MNRPPTLCDDAHQARIEWWAKVVILGIVIVSGICLCAWVVQWRIERQVAAVRAAAVHP